MAKKFYVKTFTVEVLAEDEADLPGNALSVIAHAITNGPCSGVVTSTVQTVDGPTMAMLLRAQGTDPAFFDLAPDVCAHEVDWTVPPEPVSGTERAWEVVCVKCGTTACFGVEADDLLWLC